jgi:hypothetical protein
MSKKSMDVRYYENTDFSGPMKTCDRKKVFGVKNRRVTMNISEQAFIDANELDKFMNMGYQNVLKTAITIGLNDIHRLVFDKKDLSKILRKPSKIMAHRKIHGTKRKNQQLVSAA